MSLQLIIFDCDGVIIESVDAKTRAFAKAVEPYGKSATDQFVRFHMANGGVSRTVKFAWFFKEVLQREPTSEELEEVNRRFSDASLGEVLHAQLVPGIHDVLVYWKGKLPMYVASGAPQDELVAVIQEQGLAEYFDGIYGAPPGKTALLQRILQETGIASTKSIMIGDSGTDQYAAEAVGALFYGRGQYFAHTKYPWHHDLTKLNGFLKELNSEL